MGQKIHPKGLRIGIIENWDSFWFASDSEYGKYLKEDFELRKYLKNALFKAGVSRIFIGRKANQIEMDIHTAKPGLIIGKGGREISALRDTLSKMTGKQIKLNVNEVPRPERCAILIGEYIASQLERRVSHKRVMKQAVSKALRSGAKGIKITVGGRLGGSEIARSETYRAGRVPLQTLRAQIDYGFTEAMTLYGKIGIKVWVFMGEVLGKKAKEQAKAQEEIKNKKVEKVAKAVEKKEEENKQ